MATRTAGGIYNNTNIWAENGQKDEPTFTETEGWDITYSQAGGSTVGRTLMNRNFNKASAALYDVNRFGANLPWSSVISYEIGAKIIGSDDKVYKAKTVNTNIDPLSDDGTNWKYDEKPLSGDANINIVEDNRGNTYFSLTSNLFDKANKTLDNVTVGDFLGKFEDTNNVVWSASGGKAKANYVIPEIDANRKSVILSVADNGKEIFANADSFKVEITLPLFSTLPDNWEVKLYIFDTGFQTYPTDLNDVTLILQGGDNLQRASGAYSGSYKIRSPNSVVYIRKRPTSSSFFLAGVLRNEWAANCSYNNIDFPSEGGLTDVLLTERSDDRLCDLNFTIPVGIIGIGTEWSIINGHYCKAFVINLATLNNLIDKYTTASAIRGCIVTPVLIAPNLGNGGKGTAVTTSTSLVSILGAAGSQTNQIEVALQSPTTARTGDNTLLNIQLTFQNWLQRG